MPDIRHDHWHVHGGQSHAHEHLHERGGESHGHSHAPPPDLAQRIADLEESVRRLEAKLAAEGEVGVVVAQGDNTIGRITAALRKRGDALMQPGRGEHVGDFNFNRDLALGQELHFLAAEIEQEGRI